MESEKIDLKKEILRYFSFWPYFCISCLITLFSVYSFLRYQDLIYKSEAEIQILDDAMDKDMALPTAMTIFNRSMVNLENEIYKLKSSRIITKVVKEVNYNIQFHTSGLIKSFQNHKSEWLKSSDYKIEFQEKEFDEISLFEFNFNPSSFSIDEISDDEIIYSESFNFSTNEKVHQFPFQFEIDPSDFKKLSGNNFFIKIYPIDKSVNLLIDQLIVNRLGSDSELLSISLKHRNPVIAREFINSLISEFDQDGINDRQLVFKRTIDFVDSRFNLLQAELNAIEFKKQDFKVDKKLSYLEADATLSSEQKIMYSEQVFNLRAQQKLVEMLLDEINNKSQETSLLPLNIGLEDLEINSLIKNYNELISNKNKLDLSVGENNILNKNLSSQLADILSNIKKSIQVYNNNLTTKIDAIDSRKSNYDSDFSELPVNERLLREIEREQTIKEALFLLLLQKREEASINYAVTKPSIKIVDSAITQYPHVYPIYPLFYISALVVGLLLPFIILFLRFTFDTKLHVKSDILNVIDVPVISEIPFLNSDNELKNLSSLKSNSRDILSESIRMLNANLNFRFFNKTNDQAKTVIVTSSVKGEGKTLVSASLSKVLSFDSKNKIILIGGDLRNPQLHKYLQIDKTDYLGVSDYISSNKYNWKDLIIKNDDLDIILSGTIPPNPTELLSSDKFTKFINDVKKEYDYVIIDSAPCLLVSDTLQISKHADTSVYLVRANHSEKSVLSFIGDLNKENRLKNINLVFNSVGSSSFYGYKYGYQYGYQYGYKYGYNYGYGYGYGYSEDR